MGSTKTTMQNLKILKIDPVRDLVYIHGSVPGNNGECIFFDFLVIVLLLYVRQIVYASRLVRAGCTTICLILPFFAYFVAHSYIFSSIAGVFVKMVDAVKGPFFPSPPSYPTWQAELPTTWQHCPVPLTDAGIFKEPEDIIT